MIRTKVIVAVLALAGLIALVVPGCDDLITEVNEVTIAGHPEADFSIGGSGDDSGCVPFAVTFLDQSKGPITGWSWYFGDGDSSNDTNPVHTYDSAGVYNVILKVVNDTTEGEDTELKKRYVVAGTTFSQFTSDTNRTCVGSAITFRPLQYGGITGYEWNFGDGKVNNTNDSTPTHIYDSIGVFTVKLTVQGPCGEKTQTNTDMITVTACPDVIIVADDSLGCKPFDVQFYDSSTFDTSQIALTEWEWDFGDNKKSYEQDPLHTYAEAGTYTVTLTVGSTGGTSTDSIVDMITVGDSVKAAYGAISTLGCKSQFQDYTVAFFDSSTGDITSWTWDFGDGTPGSDLQNPLHVYADPGTYSVSLEVTGICGSDTDSRAGYIIVSDRIDDTLIDYSISADTVMLDSTNDSTTLVRFVDHTPGVVSWDWNYGPSVAHGKADSVEYRYTTAGTWPVTLTLTNGCGDVIIHDTVVVLIQQ